MYAYALFCTVWLGAFAIDAEREVLVIGAGASGLAAARALTNDGKYKVTVLEARPNRYGGRIWTNIESFENVTGPEVDMGASFIHHPGDNNSVVQLHREFNLPMLDMHEALTAVREKGAMLYTQTRVESASMRVEKAFQAVRNYSVTQKTDLSVYEALRHSNQSQFIDDPLSQMFVALKEFWFGAAINKLSAKLLDIGYTQVSNASNKIPAFGYGKLMDRIVQSSPSETPLSIILGQVVKSVTVLENRRVKVKCKNNETYEADAVIVTLPLGVLKANVVKFQPDLSKRKRRAVKRIGFGVVNKLVLEFDKRFWPEHKHHLAIAVRDIADRGKFSLLKTFHAIAGKPIIVAYAISHFGKQSEKLKDNDLKLLALNRLRTVFGTLMDPVSVVKMSRTKWYKDPYARGSYSFPLVGTREDDWDVVGEAEAPLFFAGEHTRTELYGTVQNAIDTGRRAAREVTEYLENLSTSESAVSPLCGSIICFCISLLVHLFNLQL